MRAYFKLFKYSVLVTAIIFLMPFKASAWWWNDGYQCDDDDINRGRLNIMTINILFSEIEDRDVRLDEIAQFASSNNIHIILLQEVVGGFLTGTKNSAKDLQDFLKFYGSNYNLKTAFETGLPGLLAVANSILSRCEINFTLVKRLSRASEIEFGGRVIKLPRNVQMARIEIPGAGKISVYNTHWCAGCSVEELGVHWQETFKFINIIESLLPGENPVIFGGDLNLDRFRNETERFLYDSIVDNQGFADAHTDFVLKKSPLDNVTLCKTTKTKSQSLPDEYCTEEYCTIGIEHCTIGVTEYGDSTPRRIDYLFIKNFGDVLNARVVVNNKDENSDPDPPAFSDHAAVVISVDLTVLP